MKSHKRSKFIVLVDKLLSFLREISSYIEILQEDNSFPKDNETKNQF